MQRRSRSTYIIFLALLLGSSAVLSQTKNLDSLKTALNNLTGKERALNLLWLCWEYRFVNADSARMYGLEALKLSQNEGLAEYEAEAFSNIGITYEAQGNYKEAVIYEEQGLALYRKLKLPAQIANTLNNLGIAYDEMGDYEKSLVCYFEARKIYETLQEESKVAMVLTNIGIVLKAQKEYKNVEANYREALAIYKRLGNKFGQASCHANLGSVYLFIPNYDSALHYSLLASVEFEKQKIQQFLPTTWSNAAKAYQKLGQPSQAKALFLKAKELHTQYDNKKELSFTSIQLALLENELGNTSNAIKFANDGLSGALTIKALEQIMQAHEALATIHATSKNYQSAWQEHQLYVIYKDSLFQQEKAKQLLSLQLKFETEKKDNQIVQLNKDNEIKTATIQRNYFFFGGLGVILALSFFFYRYREKLKQKAIAQEQKVRLREAQINAVIDSQERERKRFASDLHDGMGQLVSALQLNIQSIKQNQELERTVSLVENSEHLLTDIQTEIRNIAFNLMPAILVKEGLLLAVRELTRRISKASSIQIELAIHDVPERLPAVVEVSVYRIIQELLANIIKHSKASKITLSFTGYKEEVVLTIEDNGNGYDLNKFQHSENSNGWRTIQTRINLIKGEIDFDTMAGRKNSTVIINIPVNSLTPQESVHKNT